jgi:hypothetical protein
MRQLKFEGVIKTRETLECLKFMRVVHLTKSNIGNIKKYLKASNKKIMKFTMTPFNHIIYYGKTHLYRASKSLLCVLFRAHGQELVCHVFFIGCTTKNRTTTSSLSCTRKNARQRSCLCHTCFSEENKVQTYMHARIKFHAYSDI